MLRYIALLFCLLQLSYAAPLMAMPVPNFEAFRPSGIRVTLPHVPGITEFFFWANINVPMEGEDLGEIQLNTYEPTNGIWLIEDMSIKLKPGDTIYYTFFVNIDGVVHRYERQEYTVKEIIERPSTTTSTTTTKPTTTSTTPKPEEDNCLEGSINIQITKGNIVITRKDKHGNEIQIHKEECKQNCAVTV